MRNLLALILTAAILAGCATMQPAAPTYKANDQELGDQAFAKGDYAKAVECYGRWLTKYPQSADAWIKQGRAQNRMKQYGPALMSFEKALQAKPEDFRAEVYRCGILVHTGKANEAYEFLQKMIFSAAFKGTKDWPYERYLAYYLDGYLKNVSDKHQEAIQSLDAAVEMCNLYRDAMEGQGVPTAKRLSLHARAAAYMKLGQFHKATPDIEEYIALSQKAQVKPASETYQALALCYYYTNQIEKCKSLGQSMDPKHRKELEISLEESLWQ